MEYKLKSVHLEADSPKGIQFPDVKDRIIEKYGEVLEFSLNDIEYNYKELLKNKKEFEAKRVYENAKKENIEHYHPFVLEMSEEDLHIAHMYKESSSWVGICDSKLKEIEEQLEKDKAEIEEIKAQIPELAEIESPYVDVTETPKEDDK